MTRRILAAAVGIALTAAFSGEADAQNPECSVLKQLSEAARKSRNFENSLVEELTGKIGSIQNQIRFPLPIGADLLTMAFRQAQERDLTQALNSLNAAKKYLAHAEETIASLQLLIELNCEQQPAAQAPPQAKPTSPAAPPAAKTALPVSPPPAKPVAPQTAAPAPPKTTVQPTSATRPAFDLRGNVRTYCEITPTFMDYAPVEVSVNAKGEAVGGFYRKGKTLLMKGEMDGGGLIRLKVLDAPEIVIEVRTSKSQGLWHGTGTFVNPPAEVSRCYPGNIGLSESKVLPDPMRFPNPTFKGYAVSNCRDFGGVGCGLPAATAFCLTEGYFRATEHKVVVDGAQAWVLGSDKVCNDPGCGRLVDVVCTRK